MPLIVRECSPTIVPEGRPPGANGGHTRFADGGASEILAQSVDDTMAGRRSIEDVE